MVYGLYKVDYFKHLWRLVLTVPDFWTGKTYVYMYETQLFSGLPENGLARAGLRLRSKVYISAMAGSNYTAKVKIKVMFSEQSFYFKNANCPVQRGFFLHFSSWNQSCMSYWASGLRITSAKHPAWLQPWNLSWRSPSCLSTPTVLSERYSPETICQRWRWTFTEASWMSSSSTSGTRASTSCRRFVKQRWLCVLCITGNVSWLTIAV